MLIYVALGGVLGTVARFGLQGWVQERAGGGFPAGTVVVNILGSLVLGFAMRYTTGSTVVSPEMRAAITIGFCGAFTTMSTFAFESQALLVDGDYGRAFAYMAVTLIGCLAFTFAGIWLADQLL
jgi:fluoride exporter